VTLTPDDYPGDFRESIDIPANTLFGDYPPKIEESEIKPVEETGEIVLSRVVIPEYVVVHDGPPTDSRAKDYYVRYKDYIKNVASSEIYATWPDATIRANVLAIMSFTLNRVFTEWYRNKGYDFTITSSTAYDQKWSYGRTIYNTISNVVDEMFENYLSRPNVTQPILTQYCDGKNVSCPNWLSQWGSKYLGDQGYSATQILRNYYGSSIYINTADEISGIPSSWPGYDLTVGSSGSKVRQLQQELNRIHQNYPAIPSVTPDGIFGASTKEAVQKFQSVFGLPANGIVDYPTWYKISEIYVGVSRIAELV
jgi:peptidoglycan hydrolase-like protein with peptidoglycan-binding domain